MSKKILVTGATGKSGREVVNQLILKGESVRVGVRDIPKAESMGWEGVEIVLFDYNKPETFKAVLEDIDRMFMVPPPMTPTTHELAIPVIDAAKQAGVNHIVYTSGMGVELVLDPGHAMLKIEDYLENCGIDCTFLGLTWFMQNCNDWLLPDIKAKGCISAPTADAKISFVDARDIGAVAAVALTSDEHRNKRYTITGGEAIDYHEVARLLTEASGRKIEYIPVSEEESKKISQADRWPEETLKIVMKTYQRAREGVYAEVSPDVENILGRPHIKFEQYAKDYAEYWK